MEKSNQNVGIEVVVTELTLHMVKLKSNVTCYNCSGHNILRKKIDTNISEKFDGITIKNSINN